MEEEGEVEKKKNSGMLNQRIQPYLVMCTRNINDGVMDEKTPAEVERVLMANHARPESERGRKHGKLGDKRRVPWSQT